MNKWLDTTVLAYKHYFGESVSPIVYEVGSRDGKDGIELAERILDGPSDKLDHSNVILFEPNPKQAEIIRKAYPKATLLEVAASDQDGTADFVQIDGTQGEIGSSSLDLNRQETKTGDKTIIRVNTRRLDGIVSELGHSRIDVMKIDAEGYTYEILEGLGDHLSSVLVLHLETEVKGIVTNKTNREVFAYMRDRGFLCFDLANEWGEDIEDQVWLNAEALRHAK